MFEQCKVRKIHVVVGFEGVGRGHQPSSAGRLKKLGKARKQIVPQNLQKETQPCQHLDFNIMRLVWV